MDNNEEKIQKHFDIKDLKDKKDPAEKPAVQELNFNSPDFSVVLNKAHDWKQRGYYIHCTNCELGHGLYIGAKQHLVGIDETGNPILAPLQQKSV